MLNHLKWRASCYLKWQSEKRKWPISLLMWHSHRTQWVQPTGQLAADGDSVRLLITQEPWLGRKCLLTASWKEFYSPQGSRVGICIRECSAPIRSHTSTRALRGTGSYYGSRYCLTPALPVIWRLNTVVRRLADQNKIPPRSNCKSELTFPLFQKSSCIFTSTNAPSLWLKVIFT